MDLCVDDYWTEEMDTWWEKLAGRLLEQEEIEDYSYEYRTEPGERCGERVLWHMRPVMWAGYRCRWDWMRGLCDRGYSLVCPEEEPVCETLCLDSKMIAQQGEECALKGTAFYALVHEKLLLRALTAPTEEAGWLCELLERSLREQLRTETGRYHLEVWLHGLRCNLCALQENRAYAQRQEECLNALRERLPQYYDMIFLDQAFWFDICVDSSTRLTMGLPSFPLLSRYLEYLETKKEGTSGEYRDVIRWLSGDCDMLEDRTERWRIALEKSVERWPDAVMEALGWRRDELAFVASMSEFEALFERMSAFFRRFSSDKTVRELYENSVRRLCERCDEMVGEIDETWREWLFRCRLRFQRELEHVGSEGI